MRRLPNRRPTPIDLCVGSESISSKQLQQRKGGLGPFAYVYVGNVALDSSFGISKSWFMVLLTKSIAISRRMCKKKGEGNNLHCQEAKGEKTRIK